MALAGHAAMPFIDTAGLACPLRHLAGWVSWSDCDLVLRSCFCCRFSSCFSFVRAARIEGGVV